MVVRKTLLRQPRPPPPAITLARTHHHQLGKPGDRPTAAAVVGTVAVMACCNTGRRRCRRISFENNQFYSDGGSEPHKARRCRSIDHCQPAKSVVVVVVGCGTRPDARRSLPGGKPEKRRDRKTNGSRKRKAGKARGIEKYGLPRLCSGHCASNIPSLSLRHNRFGNDRNRPI